MKYITLDTNTWIYLANGTEPFKILSFIKREIDNNRIKILLPEIIIDEWNKNKTKAVKIGVVTHFKKVLEDLNRISKLLGHRAESVDFFSEVVDSTEYFSDIIKKVKSKRLEVESAISDNINFIDELFKHSKTEIIKISKEVKLLAGDYALQKKAPFKTKNSFADALIFFSFLEFVKKTSIEGAFFITYNTDDFCEINNNEKKLHPDLTIDFNDAKCRFYHIIGEAINSIEKDIISQQEIEWARDQQEEFEKESRAVEYCIECTDYYNNGIKEISFDHISNVYDNRTIPDPKQLEFTFSQHLAKTEIRKLSPTISVATCYSCASDHFKCIQCGKINIIYEDDFYYKKGCSECGLNYVVEHVHVKDHIGDELIFKIVDDKIICEKCGNSFSTDELDGQICFRCEYEYGSQMVTSFEKS